MKIFLKNKVIVIALLLITLMTQTTYAASLGVAYQAHVQNVGWQDWKNNGAISGTFNQSLRIEALKINLENKQNGMDIQYRTHVENIGWQDWVYDGEVAGTTGQDLRVEAIQIKLNNANGYHVRYKVHVENIGWQDWVYDGEVAGTIGQELRVEAIQIEIVNESGDSIINYVPAKEIAERIDSRTRDEFKNVVNNDKQLSNFYNSNQIDQINQINLEANNLSEEVKLNLSELERNTTDLNSSTLSATASLSLINNQLIAIGIPASLRYGIVAEAAAMTGALADGPLPFGDIALIAVSIGVGFIIISNWDVIESKGEQISDIILNEYKKVSTEVALKIQYAVSKSFDLIENASEETGRSLPLEGEPNSTKEKVKDGKVVQRRHYDQNGKARVDEDFSDHGTPNLHSNPHYHNWDWSTGKAKRGDVINWFD